MVSIVYLRDSYWFSMSKRLRTIGGSSGNEINRYYAGEWGGNIPYIFANKGCGILVYGCLWSSATDINEDARAKIFDAPMTLIFKMG